MPVAIDRFTTVTTTPRGDRIAGRPLGRLRGRRDDRSRPAGRRAARARGATTCAASRRCSSGKGFRLHGADLTIASDVPIGAGLSSSAALEVAVGYALLDQAGHAIDRTALARACQEAEHEFAGMRCGVMDQFIACHGRAGHALMLDTRTLEMAWLPLPRGRRGDRLQYDDEARARARHRRLQRAPRRLRGRRARAGDPRCRGSARCAT